jgi:hypothetical protein
MSRMPSTPRGTSERDLLIDLARQGGFIIHALGDGLYQIEGKSGERCLKGTAAEAHRWLRSKVTS